MKKTPVIVIKFGGSVIKNDRLKKAVVRDIVALKNRGFSTVVVHGGGAEIGVWLDKINKKSRFVDGLRVTDNETIKIVEMVLSGRVNKGIVSLIHANGGSAIGLSGKDALLIQAKKKKKSLGLVGSVVKINARPLKNLIKEYIVVISSVSSDSKGTTLNVNADEAASEIAVALSAYRLIFLTDVKGVMDTAVKGAPVISNIRMSQVRKLIKNKIIQAGMVPKILSCVDALKRGVREIDIIDGKKKHGLLDLAKGKNVGTRIIH